LSRARNAARRARSAAGRALAPIERRVFPPTVDPAEHWQRQVMNEALDRGLRELGPEELSAAEISGSFRAGLGWREHVSLDYPDFDILEVPDPPGRRFDVVICEQVLEHVDDPWLAASNLRRLTTPGGHVVISSPFLVKVHELPQYGMRDYWRFTPRGLRVLLERAGLEVESVGSWGNRDCVVGNLRGWSAYRAWHSLANEPDLPLQVWAFARNPGTGA
jgi:SAM-dependent methyltransferase